MPFHPDPNCGWLCPVVIQRGIILIAVLNLDWKSRNKGGTLVYSCLVCRDGREKVSSNCKDHENTYTHQQNLKRYKTVKTPTQISSSSSAVYSFPTNINEPIQEEGVRALLRSITAKPDNSRYPPDGLILPEVTRSPSPGTLPGLSWNPQDDLVLDDDPWKNATSRLVQSTLSFLNGGDLSEEDENERSDLSDGEMGRNSRTLHSFSTPNEFPLCVTDFDSEDETLAQQLEPPKKRSRNHTTDESTARYWYPWQDRIVRCWKVRLLQIVLKIRPL